MQGQSSSVESIPEAFEFDLGSNPTNSGMDQPHLWNSMLLNPVEPQSVSSYAMSSVDANTSYLNISNHENARSSIWSLGTSSSSHHPQTQCNHEETKLEHGWAPPLSIGAAGVPRMGERNFETSNALSLENANFNFNNSQVDGQPLSQFSSLNNIRLNSEISTDQVVLGSEIPDLRLFPHPCNSGLWNFEHHSSSIGSSNPHGSSSMSAESVQEDDGGNSVDGRRSACKRKNIEGFPGQSSTSGTASSSHQMEGSFLRPASYSYNPIGIPNSLDYLPAPSSSVDFLPGFAAPARGMFSDCYVHANAAGNAESSQRNYRMRINNGQLHDVSSSLLSSNAGRHYNIWSATPNQLASHSIPLNRSLEPTAILSTSASQSQPHLPVVPGLPQPVYHIPWNGAANLRIGSSSSSFNTEDRVIAARDESNSRNRSMASNLDFVPATDIAHITQDPSSWSLGSRAINMAPSAQASASSGLFPPVGPTWLPHQSAPTQYPRSLSETLHQTLPSSGSSEPGGQASNFARPRSSHSYNPQEMAQPVRASSRSSQLASHIRTALMMEQQNEGVWGAPLSMRNASTSREARNRMMLEIRHVLENIRRGQGLRFEDMFVLDQTVILAGADLHDRHRDMRLDVDNMSYEELLALEEQIGDVSTGLSEETVSKHLKQRKHSPWMLEQSMGNEPCCICQEEYVEGEDIGTLDCGHDFHIDCIKQWLTHKNLCPICKNTALRSKEKLSAIFGT